MNHLKSDIVKSGIDKRAIKIFIDDIDIILMRLERNAEKLKTKRTFARVNAYKAELDSIMKSNSAKEDKLRQLSAFNYMIKQYMAYIKKR